MNPKSQFNQTMFNTFREEKEKEKRNPIVWAYKDLLVQTVRLFTMQSMKAVIDLRTSVNAHRGISRVQHSWQIIRLRISARILNLTEK
jgi:hypothetical protein